MDVIDKLPLTAKTNHNQQTSSIPNSLDGARASAFALDLPVPSFCAKSQDPDFFFAVSLAMDSAMQLRCAQDDG
jgi:hypothetical protein